MKTFLIGIGIALIIAATSNPKLQDHKDAAFFNFMSLRVAHLALSNL